MKVQKLLSDWLLVQLEPEKKTTAAGLVLVGDNPIRTGKVLHAGPGRQHRDRFVAMEPDIVGKRVVFFRFAMDGHKQGRLLRSMLDEDKAFIRYHDILLFIDGNVEIS